MPHDGHLERGIDIAGRRMRTDFRWLMETTPLTDVVDALDRERVDELPVLDPEGHVKGIVRREDLGAHDESFPAGALARHDIAPASYDEPVAEVVAQMRAAHVSALPVISHAGYVEGIVVLDELARRQARARARSRATEAIRHPLLALRDNFPVAAVGGSLALLALALLGITYGAPTWLSWVDAVAALLAGLAGALYRTPEALGVALSAFLISALSVVWLFGLQVGWPAWLTWLHLVAAIGFLILTVAGGTVRRRYVSLV
jgi:CBS domain-containing protein